MNDPGSGSAAADTVGDSYAEINESSFQMKVNKCYYNVKASSSPDSNKERSPKKRERCPVAIPVLVAAMMTVLVITSVCVMTALVQVAAVQRENNAVNNKLMVLGQNFSQFNSDFRQLLADIQCPSFIFSCSSLHRDCHSGYYLSRASNGSVVRVYCDMTLSCGNITGGWMRVAELNMTDTSQQCPGNFVDRNESGIRQCRIPGKRCYSVHHPTPDISYSSVCGRIKAYQVGSTNGFRGAYSYLSTTIDSNYVDGVSLTHGSSPRQHIWTFAAALDRTGNFYARGSYCPCQNSTQALPAPPFVGEDYFCDAGNEEFMTGETGLQTDPLWDGTDCLCCDNPPWFYKQLPQPTTDDIEMRLCRDDANENIAIEVVNIYIQ